jgi:hypothetical protein
MGGSLALRRSLAADRFGTMIAVLAGLRASRALFVVTTCVVGVSAGCVGPTSGGAGSTLGTNVLTQPVEAGTADVMSPGRGDARVRGVRISWRRLPDGEVCYDTTRPGHPHRGGNGSLSACVRHLRADEITFVIKPRGTGQQMIAGLKGPHVKSVYLRFAQARRWTPSISGSAFFGYVPAGQVVGVVKVLDDGSRMAFRVRVRSK